MNKSLTLLLASLLAALVGFGIGRWSGLAALNPPSSAGSNAGGPSSKTFTSPTSGSSAEAGGVPGPGHPATLLGLDDVLGNPSRKDRERDLEALGESDFAKGVDWKAAVDKIGDRVDREHYLRGVISNWAAQDPNAAIDYLRSRSFATQCNLVPHAIGVWAEKDPLGAESWALAQQNGEVRDRSVESLYRSWAIDDPEAAAARSLALQDGSARYRALVGVVQEWSANDLGAVEAWASKIPDPGLKDFARMAVADEMASRSPSEAMRWAGKHLAEDPQANPSIISVVASKAGFESPKETFEWLRSIPPSQEASSSLAGVATYLAESDPDFAETGFDRLPPEMKEVTAAPVASILGGRDPQAGMRWLEKLPTGNLKDFAASAFAAGWATRDPVAAEAWSNSLPAGSLKDAVLQGLQNAGGAVQ